MTNMQAVDKLEMRVLVDNVTDSLSTVPDNVLNEWPSLEQAGMTQRAGEFLCCAHHGLSFVLTAYSGETKHTLLLDGGPEGYAVERNGSRLGIDFGGIESIVLSHGHWDHGGGLIAALRLITKNNGNREVPFYAHPDMFRSRGMQDPNGKVQPSKDVPNPEELSEQGAEMVVSAEPQTPLDGMFFVSGEIPRVTPYEKGLPGQMRKSEDGKSWEPDPWIMDERFVAVNVREKGIVVLTACSHAGVINILKHARECFPNERLHAVAGGFHLAGPTVEGIIPDTVEGLKAFELDLIVPGHCTGWRAVAALVNAFGEDVIVPSAVGRLFTFQHN